MNSHIIKIGNSLGIRIPKVLLEQTGLSGEVTLAVSGNSLVISPVACSRAGWEDAFREMAARGDDVTQEGAESLDHSFDNEEWEWK